MASSTEIPSIALAGDISIPQFGLGVFQVAPEET
ncbi:MAG: aldo/keto reductase, partial [Solirubrobacterales bacterium]|nr:aldo/keto reductase [Solirubrobacterales bacterium]